MNKINRSLLFTSRVVITYSLVLFVHIIFFEILFGKFSSLNPFLWILMTIGIITYSFFSFIFLFIFIYIFLTLKKMNKFICIFICYILICIPFIAGTYLDKDEISISVVLMINSASIITSFISYKKYYNIIK